jgi:ribonuclease E
MPKSMFVNVTAEEENRVAIVENGVLDVFEIETLSKEHLKGNIFKVIVEGLNPALEAAFVNYGGERAGFLPLDEINFKLYPSRNEGPAPGKGRGARITRHLDKGMEVLVQVIRDAFGNKPPTMSTYYSLPGRYLVLMPGADAAGISRKIESAEQRERLRKILEELTVPSGFGVIVRTAGMETSSRELQGDLESLLELWRTIETAAQQVKAPALIFQERDLVIRTIRDYFTTDIEEVLIDDEPAYLRARKFFEAHMPDKAEVVKLYTGDKPIFTKHNVEDQIERIYKRTVQLKSGGSISIDQTEALTAIDVNSARSTRAASSEDTATRTNLEAAEEIARQLRLRDIGGLIVIDFIDMESSKHIRQAERAFADAMSRDKARYDVTRISKLGLMEVSRQRIRATKASSSFMECPTCQGDGTVRTPEAAARSAFRKIQARVVKGDISGVKVFLAPEVALHLLNQKRDDLARLEGRYRVTIEVVPEERMKASQFEIEEVRREEPEVAPMVTADTVDEALVSGTLPPAPRPVEAQESPTPLAPQREAGDGTTRRRRRRRRHKTGGATAASHPDSPMRPEDTGVAAARSDGRPAGEDASDHASGDSEESPVFSEGPEDETRVQGGALQSDAPGPVMPRLAELPTTEGGPQVAPHRRHRRRRRRGRGGNAGTRPGGPPSHSADRSAFGNPRGGRAPRGNGTTDFVPQEASAPPKSPPIPSPISTTPAQATDSATSRAGTSTTGEPPVDAQGEAKPKRRWWRRSLTRG